MRAICAAFLALGMVLGGCGVSYPAAAPPKTPANPVVTADSLKGDIQERLDRAFARDDIIMGEAGKAKTAADQARFTKQAYHELFGATSEIHDRAGGVTLNPFEARRKKAILGETESSLWKLRYLEKEGGAKARDDDARLAHYEQLHSEALAGLNRVQAILKGRG